MGATVGAFVGRSLGAELSSTVDGPALGRCEGDSLVGDPLGCCTGSCVGDSLSTVGLADGAGEAPESVVGS